MRNRANTPVLDAAAKAADFMQTRSQALKTGTCVQCAKKATDFRDEASQGEYKITAMCQVCQDSFFGVED